MRKLTAALLVFGLAFGITACKEGNSAEGNDDNAKAEQTANAGGDHVKVPAKGKKFDPSVSVDKMPEGAWACDMGGKSHWAAMEKPEDGKCPVCNMQLSEAGHGDHGEHGDHGH